MRSKKINKIFIIIIALIIFVTSATFYYAFNLDNPKNEVRLNLFEQNWLDKNKNEVINVYIPNNIPIYSRDGKGIIFNFLTYFEEETGLEFNKTSYNLGEENNKQNNFFRVVRSEDKLNDNDLLFFNDNYVVVGKEKQTKIEIDNLNGKIGVLKSDYNAIVSYLNNNKVAFTSVEAITDLVSVLENGEVSYIIIPKNIYLNLIIESKYYIVNTLNDLYLKYVLTINKDEDRLNAIIKKYYDKWIKENVNKQYYAGLFSLYYNINGINDKNVTDFKSKRYIYGYIDNIPYEVMVDGNLNGISGEFINYFSLYTDVEFKFKAFKNVDDLNKALDTGNIDIAFNYYQLNKDNKNKTIDLINSKYVILSKDSNVVIDTIKSLKDKELYALKGSSLTNYIKTNGKFNVKEVNDISSLKDKKLILLDYNNYVYYSNKYFNDYNIAYSNITNDNYGYFINNSDDNKLFYDIFEVFLANVNHEEYKNNGLEKEFNKTYKLDFTLLWIYIIIVPIFVFVLILVMNKRKQIIKIRNDVKIKYIDPLTSLKNRYYLNNNISKWEENNVYPQAIIVINVNNLKNINDEFGHDIGDNIIKTTANILINNQLEKTDIVRSDGSEFLIYMVGYKDNNVVSYMRKLNNLFKDIPSDYGVSLGYSMIEDDIKTLEDAINEAILDMETNRESKKGSES